MELEQIQLLPRPNMDILNLSYIKGSKDIYVNLFKINLQKDLNIYQYPYAITPEISNENMTIRDKLFKYAMKKIKQIYGEFFQSGDCIYGTTLIKEIKGVNAFLYGKDGKTEYIITFQPCSNITTLKNQNIQDDQLAKQIIETLIRDILSSNPNLDFYRNLFVNRTNRREISGGKERVDFFPGFTTSFVYTMNGSFLNVTLKNKILSIDTILDYLEENKYNDKKNQQKIKDDLIGRSFKVGYAKRNYRIDDIDFQKNPENTTINRDGHSMNLLNYYKIAHDIQIKNKKQPLIVVKSNDTKIYFIPELSYLGGLNDSAIKNGQFMKELANYTKLKPDLRVNKTNEFVQLLNNTENKIIKPKKSKDDKEKEKDEIKIPSAKEKKDKYGIEILPIDRYFKAYYIESPSISAGQNKTIGIGSKVFKALTVKPFNNWLCLYEKHNYNQAEQLFETMKSASKGYGITVSEPEWVEMPDRSNNANDWTATVDDYYENHKYDFVLFLLDRNDFIYPQLKKHSLVNCGYISQVVKTFSLRKNAMSVCSKIILQINAKLDGASYKINFSKDIYERKLMVIGVDSSHFGHNTGVAMVATTDKDFTSFYNKEEVIKEENKAQLEFKVSLFIEEALKAYFKKNKTLPSGVIIYRQGVSLQQKDYLTNEVIQIQERLNGNIDQSFIKGKNTIPYYYILVNTKTNYKFFEVNPFKNPAPGLLVIDGITNPKFFEFYLQPQEVTGGSATPSCFHVAYGNMNSPEFIPKFTYDLCHTYANWQGPVRIPNVIKAAEKLSKVTSKYTKGSLHPSLSNGQSYL